LLLIVQAHELQAAATDVGRIGPICFLDMRVSDQQQVEPVVSSRVMRLNDEQEVRAADLPRRGVLGWLLVDHALRAAARHRLA
jgi:hypothetical protein